MKWYAKPPQPELVDLKTYMCLAIDLDQGMGKTIQAISLILSDHHENDVTLAPEKAQMLTAAPHRDKKAVTNGGRAMNAESIADPCVANNSPAPSAASGPGEAADVKPGKGAAKSAAKGAVKKGKKAAEPEPLKPPPPPIVSPPPGGACKTTLVVCPVVALTQWRDEIERHTAPRALKVHIYHGPKRYVPPRHPLHTVGPVVHSFSSNAGKHAITALMPCTVV